MTFALGVEPVALSLFVGIKDVASERFWPRRGGCSRCTGFSRHGRLAEMRADYRRFAHPLFERFVPGKSDQQNGNGDFEEKAHLEAGLKAVGRYRLSIFAERSKCHLRPRI